MLDTNGHTVEQQFEAIQASYPSLTLHKNGDGSYLISGRLSFRAQYEELIEDSYSIEIFIPINFPQEIPWVRETAAKIPPDFHKNGDDTLCLGVLIEIRQMFAQGASLLDYLNDRVVHYLYAFSYYKKHDKMPFSERSHAGKGVLECYGEMFGIENEVNVLGLMRLLADGEYRGHSQCPCSGKKSLRSCHGSKVRELASIQTRTQFMYDYRLAIQHLLINKVNVPPMFISKKLSMELKQIHK